MPLKGAHKARGAAKSRWQGLLPFGLAIFVFGLAFVVGSAPSLCVALALTLFRSGLGRKNGSQARRPALNLG